MPKTWVTATTIAKELGVTTRHIHNLREKILKKGVHWRKVSSSTAMRPSYRFNYLATLSALEKNWK
ncbi:MAG: excisionase family protein [Prochlorotrichaceae cyanobacterium]